MFRTTLILTTLIFTVIVPRQRLWHQLVVFDKREFLAHRNEIGVMNETEYENPGFFVREDGQRHPPRDTSIIRGRANEARFRVLGLPFRKILTTISPTEGRFF